MKKTNTITVNQMIYDTLKTKKSKTPKYYDVLTKMGYKLYNGDDGWSAYDYWEIFTVDGDYLNISRTRGGKRALFKSSHNCNSVDLTKVSALKPLQFVAQLVLSVCRMVGAETFG